MSLLGTLKALDAARRRPDGGDDAVVDFSFEIKGQSLPGDYPAGLDAALLDLLPWAGNDPFFGIHPVNAPLTDAGYMLSRRSRLQLRAFESRASELERLTGQVLNFGDATVSIGTVTHRPVKPFATLRAQMVVNSFADEVAFIDDIGMQLEVLAIKAGVICGKAASVRSPSGRLEGFAVVVHDLSPGHSLRLQTIGLGGARRLGCGLFVHHKIIEGPEAWPE
jgi:CRISPR-associated protein Cas6